MAVAAASLIITREETGTSTKKNKKTKISGRHNEKNPQENFR